MSAKAVKLLAWSPEATALLTAAREAMPDGAKASDSAVVRFGLRCAVEASEAARRRAAQASETKP